MESPFPGMDPYLEDRLLFPDFHHLSAEALRERLNANLGPRYYAGVEIRTVGAEIEIGEPVLTIPDVAVIELTDWNLAPGAAVGVVVAPAPIQRPSRLPGELTLRAVNIYLVGTDRLVTTIELLSPYNKRYGEGLNDYKEKRAHLLQSQVHFVEIDLLRGGERPGPEVAEPPLDTDYVLLVNRYRGANVRISEIWPLALNEPLPVLPIPLLPPDPDVVLDMTSILRDIYQRGAYYKRIDYRKAIPPPPLRPALSEWWADRQPA